MDLAFLNGPIGGALIALVTGVVVFWLNERREFRLERLRDARAIRDARHERLRSLYEGLLVLAREAQSTASAIAQDQGKRVERFPALAKAAEDFRRLEVRLTLEGQQNIATLYHTIIELLPAASRGGPALTRLESAVNALEVAMRDSLSALEQPIGRA